jgi:hypothetical protein
MHRVEDGGPVIGAVDAELVLEDDGIALVQSSCGDPAAAIGLRIDGDRHVAERRCCRAASGNEANDIDVDVGGYRRQRFDQRVGMSGDTAA